MWRSEKTKNEILKIFASSETLVIFDVETTGFNAEKNHVIQFSGIKYAIINGEMYETERFDTYINPGCLLPEKITEITGITDELLRNAPREADVFFGLYSFLGATPLVGGHNITFDIRFIKAMYARYGYEFIPCAVLDTLEMARDLASLSNGAANNKLGTLANYFGVDYGLTFHNSMDDVIACSRLLKIFFKEYKEQEDAKKVLRGNVTEKTIVKVQSLRFWKGYRGHSRIYIYTDCGDFFYDVFKKTWDKGNNCFYDIETIDMEQLRTDSFKMANVTTEREFARFRG